MDNLWRRGVVVITTAQLHSTKPQLRFCAGSNPAHGVSEIHDGEDPWQWSRLEIRLNAFLQSTIPQKQFIIFIIITKIKAKDLDNNNFTRSPLDTAFQGVKRLFVLAFNNTQSDANKVEKKVTQNVFFQG